MHIVLVGDHPLPDDTPHGGVQRVMHSFRQALAGHADVTLIVPQSARALHHTDGAGKIIYLKKSRLPGTLVYWNLVSRRIGREIARLAPDVVHIQGAAGYDLAWATPRAPFATIFTVHGMLHKDILLGRPGWLRTVTAPARAWLSEWVERRGRNRADAVIVINDYVLEEMPDLVRRQHAMIPNPVDAIFLAGDPAPRPARAAYEFVSIGGIWQRKNTLESITLIAELAMLGRAANLSIIGPTMDPVYLQLCRDTVARHGLGERVRFLGELAAPGIIEVLDQADCLLVTSLRETAPMVVAEAQCRGVPAAVTPHFGLRYMVDDGVNGVFLDAPPGLGNARKIAALLDHRLDATRIARQARATYDIDVVVQRTIEVYRDAIARRQISKPGP